MQPFVYRMHILGLGILMSPIVGAFGIQLTGDMPCPLCLLQRIAMFIMGMGAMLNLRFGIKTAHYGYCIFGGIFGLLLSSRQILLHICETPGSGYGGSVAGIHLYTWALIVFLCFLIAVGVFLLLPVDEHSPAPLSWENYRPARWMGYFVTGLALLQVIATFLECGPFQCPDNPTGYWIL
ncbi:MAG: disulfide bond formation protein B [Polyangiaceae bacterium]|nr:disulfide bond formation protein B [Polyangiaceae bacterium]